MQEVMHNIVLQTIQMVGSKMLSLARGKSKRELPLKTSPSTAIHPHVSHLLTFPQTHQEVANCFL